MEIVIYAYSGPLAVLPSNERKKQQTPVAHLEQTTLSQVQQARKVWARKPVIICL